MLRQFLGSAALATTGLLALGVGPAIADDNHERHASHMLACAKVCAGCQVECDYCFAHCRKLVVEGRKEHADTMQICLDCADACKLAAMLSARLSPVSVEACDSCAKICDKCAATCDKYKDDARMAQCSKSCRECAKVCRDMIEQMQK